jgi:hypothetical protein
MPEMQSFIVDRLRIEPRTGALARQIALDGEIVSMTPPLEYRLVKDALTVVVGDAEGIGSGNGARPQGTAGKE